MPLLSYGHRCSIANVGGTRALQLKNGASVRGFLGSERFGASSAWTEITIGLRVRSSWPDITGDKVIAAGRSIGDSNKIWMGICSGTAGALANTAVSQTITAWAGFTTGNTVNNIAKTATNGNTDETYTNYTFFPQIFENGTRKANAAGVGHFVSVQYWTGIIFFITRSGSTISVRNPLNSPITRNVDWPEIIDIVNYSKVYTTAGSYANSTYGWSTSPTIVATATIDEGTYGALSHFEIGSAAAIHSLYIGGMIIRGWE